MKQSKRKVREEVTSASIGRISSPLLLSSIALVIVLSSLCYVYTGKEKPTALQMQSHGGWRPGSAEDLALLDTRRCNIERRNAASLKSEEFESKYRYQRPVLVTFANGTAEWTRSDLFTRESLTKEYGHWSVTFGKSLDIVKQGGAGNDRASFNEFVDKLVKSKESSLLKSTSDEPLYIFDRKFYKDSDLPDTLHPPDFFRVQAGADESFFFMGGSKSGVSFHKHADAWNGVVYGRKRWFLYPSEKTPPGGVWPGFSQLDWYRKVYPRLEEGDLPLECVQEAGEILYLPESYYHGTLNIGDTLAIGWQKKAAVLPAERIHYDATEMLKELSGASERDEKLTLCGKLAAKYKQLVELLPLASEGYHKYGEALFNCEKRKEGLKVMEKAVEIDPLFVIAHSTIGGCLKMMGDLDGAHRAYQKALKLNPLNFDVNVLFAEVMLENKKLESALELYKRAAILNSKQPVLYSQMAYIQKKLGNHKEAKRMINIAQLLAHASHEQSQET